MVKNIETFGLQLTGRAYRKENTNTTKLVLETNNDQLLGEEAKERKSMSED